MVNVACVVNRPAFILGLAGGTFFLIGGAGMAIAAIVLAAIPGMIAGILFAPEPDAGARGSTLVGSWRAVSVPTPLARR